MTLAELNSLQTTQLLAELQRCCGSKKWSEQVASQFPFENKEELFQSSDAAWNNCDDQDFMQAFAAHPKIGDRHDLHENFPGTSSWAADEQAGIKNDHHEVLDALVECNKLYEEKFGYIFIINATGKSAEEMLGSLRWRLLNTPGDEIRIAAGEQQEITKIRLEKLLS